MADQYIKPITSTSTASNLVRLPSPDDLRPLYSNISLPTSLHSQQGMVNQLLRFAVANRSVNMTNPDPSPRHSFSSTYRPIGVRTIAPNPNSSVGYIKVPMQPSPPIRSQIRHDMLPRYPRLPLPPSQPAFSFLRQPLQPTIRPQNPPVTNVIKTIAYSQVNIPVATAANLPKTKVMMPSESGLPLRPAAKMLEDIALCLIDANYPDSDSQEVLSKLDKPQKRRLSGDDEDFDIHDISSSSSSEDSDESSSRYRNKKRRLSAQGNISAPVYRQLEDVQWPLTHLIVPSRHECPGCGLKTETLFALHSHYQIGHVTGYGESLQRKCCLCPDDVQGMSTPVFSNHITEVHSIPSLATLQDSPNFACVLCFSDRSKRSQLLKHMVTCASQRYIESRDLAPALSHVSFLLRHSTNSTVSYLFGHLKGPDSTQPIPKAFSNISRPEVNADPSVDKGNVIAMVQKSRVPMKNDLVNFYTDQKAVVCEICNGMVADNESLLRHFSLCHAIDLISSVSKAKAGRSVACQDCTKRFWVNEGLYYHRQGIQDRCPAGRICGVCKVPQSVYKIYDHMLLKHTTQFNQLVESSQQCLVCLNGRDQPLGNHKIHIIKIHNLGHLFSAQKRPPIDPPLSGEGGHANASRGVTKCPRCAVTFLGNGPIALSHLRDHMLAVGHRFLCSQWRTCSARFTSRCELERHETVVHILQQSRLCEICEAPCSSASLYLLHMQVSHIVNLSVSTVRLEDMNIPGWDPITGVAIIKSAPPPVVEVPTPSADMLPPGDNPDQTPVDAQPIRDASAPLTSNEIAALNQDQPMAVNAVDAPIVTNGESKEELATQPMDVS